MFSQHERSGMFLSDVLVQCSRQSCVDDLTKNLAGNWEQCDTSPVVAFSQVTLLRQFDNESRLPRLRNLFTFPYPLEYVCQKEFCFRFFSHFCYHFVCSTCLSTLYCFNGCFYLLKGSRIYADDQILFCRWDFCHLCRFCPI